MQSKRISNLVQSDIRAMTQECIRVGGINLGQGLCELPTPDCVVRGAQEALAVNEKSVYSPPEGILELRQEISKKLLRQNHIVAGENEIVVTLGATGAYANALIALLNPGDGVILFEPYYGYHLNAALLAELEPQIVPFSESQNILTEEIMQKYIQSNTKAIVVCTPGNPSGKMWTVEEIDALAKLAKKNNLLVISDEMYEYFRFEGVSHISPMSHPELKDRCVTMMGLSKTFSITGWRLGYAVASASLTQKLRLANDLFYVCAPTPLQYGVLAGLKELGPEYYSELQFEFQKKRDQICGVLADIGMPPLVPQGAYYVLADISKYENEDSKRFALKFLEKTKVAAVPGRSFFSSDIGNKYIRFCFAVNDQKFHRALEQIANFRG